jgi:LPXTG-motif cell wall-anchored protein
MAKLQIKTKNGVLYRFQHHSLPKTLCYNILMNTSSYFSTKNKVSFIKNAAYVFICAATLLSVPFLYSATHTATAAATHASVEISPKKITAGMGSTFSVDFSIKTNVPVYTVKIDGTFPKDLVKLDGFNIDEPWLKVPQPGYDEIDQMEGTFIKTAGYPEGLKKNEIFGTAYFTVIGTGTASLAITNKSLILDENSDNILSTTTLAQATISTTTATSHKTAWIIAGLAVLLILLGWVSKRRKR